MESATLTISTSTRCLHRNSCTIFAPVTQQESQNMVPLVDCVKANKSAPNLRKWTVHDSSIFNVFSLVQLGYSRLEIGMSFRCRTSSSRRHPPRLPRFPWRNDGGLHRFPAQFGQMLGVPS